MAEHHELVAQMPYLEQMGTEERQKLAKKRRTQQIKRWAQQEKEWISKEKQINKRLANTISEENNGLNLRGFTSYSKSSPTSTGNNTRGSSVEPSLLSSSSKQIPGSNLIVSNYKDCKKVISAKKGGCDIVTSTKLSGREKVCFESGVMLFEAAARNDLEEVIRLCSLGVSPNSVNHDGLTPLHQCCIDASESMMSLLLEQGAYVDARDMEQWTPLHAACTCGHLNLVKKLIDNGANLLSVNGDGNLPFDICDDEATLDYLESQMVSQGITQELIEKTRNSVESKMLIDIEELLQTGGDINASDESGVTLLHIACANGFINATELLLKRGANVNACDKDLWTSLHAIACWGNMTHIKILELLVEYGPDMNARTINDETVFDLCTNTELLERLAQLKDELEKNAADESNVLKRSQRTHSRVHSIRRISIRDKNLISRRDKRQEALMRVDSLPSAQKGMNELKIENFSAEDIIDDPELQLLSLDQNRVSSNKSQLNRHINDNASDKNKGPTMNGLSSQLNDDLDNCVQTANKTVSGEILLSNSCFKVDNELERQKIDGVINLSNTNHNGNKKTTNNYNSQLGKCDEKLYEDKKANNLMTALDELKGLHLHGKNERGQVGHNDIANGKYSSDCVDKNGLSLEEKNSYHIKTTLKTIAFANGRENNKSFSNEVLKEHSNSIDAFQQLSNYTTQPSKQLLPSSTSTDSEEKYDDLLIVNSGKATRVILDAKSQMLDWQATDSNGLDKYESVSNEENKPNGFFKDNELINNERQCVDSTVTFLGTNNNNTTTTAVHQTTANQPQNLVPVNLTLANLKKQRSDMRNNRLAAGTLFQNNSTQASDIASKQTLVDGTTTYQASHQSSSNNNDSSNKLAAECAVKTSSALRKYRKAASVSSSINGNRGYQRETEANSKCCVLI